MPDPHALANTLLELLIAEHGDPQTPTPIRDQAGKAVLFGSSSLDIGIQAITHASSPPPAHACPLDEPSRRHVIEHRSTSTAQLRVDLWHWYANPDPEAEQSLDLAATFVRDGEVYRLDLFSNSIDFQKGLSRELPSAMTWPSLLAVVREFVGAPLLGGS